VWFGWVILEKIPCSHASQPYAIVFPGSSSEGWRFRNCNCSISGLSRRIKQRGEFVWSCERNLSDCWKSKHSVMARRPALGSIRIQYGILLDTGPSGIRCRSNWWEIRYKAKSLSRCPYQARSYAALDTSHHCRATLTTHSWSRRYNESDMLDVPMPAYNLTFGLLWFHKWNSVLGWARTQLATQHSLTSSGVEQMTQLTMVVTSKISESHSHNIND